MLKRNLEKHRARAWACEGGGVPFIDSAPWEQWSFDSTEAFEQLEWKVIVPKPMPDAEDVIWSSAGIFFQRGRDLRPVPGGPRRWLDAKVKPGMAVAIESLHRTEAVKTKMQMQFFEQLGVPAVGIDLYAARVRDQEQVGSYGWHADTVDALIYVLEGRKRVRVAGYAPGSKVGLDRTVGPGSAVYVPGGRFHHVLAMPGAPGGGEWAKVLSVGFVVANNDRLEERHAALEQALRDKGLLWSSGKDGLKQRLPAALPPSMDFSDVGAYDDRGTTALHRLAAKGDSRTLSFMLKFARPAVEARTRGDDGDLVAGRSRTALGVALCCCPQEAVREIVELLVHHGAQKSDVERAGGTGRRASEVAAERGIGHVLRGHVEL